MAKSASLQMEGWKTGLDKLGGPLKESLARRMLVEGGVVLRDEAILRAPLGEAPYNPESRGSQQPGTLKATIYLARDTKLTTQQSFTYAISWPRTSFWGRFAEFGWWQTYAIGRKPDGTFFTDVTRPLKSPIRHPAQPFLRPAFDAKIDDAKAAMIARGKEELPNLMRELS